MWTLYCLKMTNSSVYLNTISPELYKMTAAVADLEISSFLFL